MPIKPTIPQGTNIFREIGLGNFQGTSQAKPQNQTIPQNNNQAMPSGDPDIELVKSLLTKGDLASLMEAKERISAITASKMPQQQTPVIPKPIQAPAAPQTPPQMGQQAQSTPKPPSSPTVAPDAPKAAPTASAAPSQNSVLADLTKLVQATYNGHNGPKTLSAQAAVPASPVNPAAPGPKPV